MTKYLAFSTTLLLITYTCGQFNTTLTPEPPLLHVCHREKTTLHCREDGFFSLQWNWNRTVTRDYTSGAINDAINSARSLLINDDVEVTTTILSYGPSHVHSKLQFKLLSENFTSIIVECNRLMLVITLKDCDRISSNFSINQNGVFDSNTANIRISWSRNVYFNSAYFVNLSISSEYLTTVSTDNSFIDINMTFEIQYNIHVYTYCCGMVEDVGNFDITIFGNHTLSIQGDIFYESNILSNNSNIEESIATNISEICSSNASSSLQTVIISVESVVMILSVALNFTLLAIIVIIKKRKQQSYAVEKNTTIPAEMQTFQDTLLYEQVNSDKEVTIMMANSAYGIQRNKTE